MCCLTLVISLVNAESQPSFMKMMLADLPGLMIITLTLIITRRDHRSPELSLDLNGPYNNLMLGSQCKFLCLISTEWILASWLRKSSSISCIGLLLFVAFSTLAKVATTMFSTFTYQYL
jgi:hypothetical protein